MSAIRYELDSDQILTLTIDMPGQSANTLNAAFREGRDHCLGQENLFRRRRPERAP